MKICRFLSIASLTLASLTLGPPRAHATDGIQDPTFLGAGFTTIDFGPPLSPTSHVDDYGLAVAVMSDERLVVAGDRSDYSSADVVKEYAITRLMPDGGVDPLFATATGGKVADYCNMSAAESPQPPESHANGVVVQADGRIVVGGFCIERGNANQGPRRAFIARYKPDGSRDLALDGTWSTLITFSGSYANQPATGRAIALQADGEIVLVGDVLSSTGYTNWFVARFNADLTLENVVTFPGSYNDYAHAVAIQADGKIIVAGTRAISASSSYIKVARLMPTLELDINFEVLVFYVGAYLNGADAVAIDSAVNRIYVAGYASLDGGNVNSDYVIESLDGSGNPNGFQTFHWNHDGHHVPNAIAVQSDHKILVTGQVDNGGGNFQIGTLRVLGPNLSPTTVLDTTFGTLGYSSVGPASGTVASVGYAMALQGDKPVLVGSTDYNKVAHPEQGVDFAVARLQNNVPVIEDLVFDVNDTADLPAVGADTSKCLTTPNNTCTLRAAIMQANLRTSSGVTIRLPAGTYNLTNGELELATPLGGIPTPAISIIGAGATTTIIHGDATDRIFAIDASREAAISGVTISNGNVTASPEFGSGIANFGTLALSRVIVTGNHTDYSGSGIYNLGNMVIRDSLISANMTKYSDGFGAGISNGGELTILGSTISNNIAPTGSCAGIDHHGSSMTIVNSTIAGNESGEDGGGIRVEGGSANIYNSTIAYNVADKNNQNFGNGGGIYIYNLSTAFHLDVKNTLLAGNYVHTAAAEYDDCGGGGILYSYSWNLLGTSATSIAGCPTSTVSGNRGFLNSVDYLGPLGDNGGPTPTIPLLAGSNAINSGVGCVDANSQSILYDQRGFPRTVGACDVGAYEAGAVDEKIFHSGFEAFP